MRAVLRQPGGSDHEALQGWIVELCEAAIAEALPSEAPPNPRGRRKRRRTVVL